MRRILDLPLLVVLMGIVALAMYLPAAHALVLGNYVVARGFFYSGSLLLILTAMAALATANQRSRNLAHSHLRALAAAYVVLPVMMALPVLWSLPDTSLLNAWFEMVSSFTTTGATVYDTPGRLPPSLHLWRAQVGWMGGFFVLVMAGAVLAPLNLGGAEVISGRVPGRSAAGVAQVTNTAAPPRRILRVAQAVLPVYGGLTLLLWVGLLLLGEDGLVALCHAMSTLSTSGIVPDSGLQAAGLAGEMLIFVFLAVAITRRAMPGSSISDTRAPIWRDPEVRMAAALVITVSAVLFLRHIWSAAETDEAQDVTAAIRALWGAVFTTFSFLTTTGFESAAWTEARGWSGIGTPGLILLGLAIFGGGVATTAGGMKLLRVYALFRQGEHELELIIYPRSVAGAGPAARRLRTEGAYVAWLFFILFALSILVIMAALTLVSVPFEAAMVLSVAALTTTGQLAAVAADSPISYASLAPAAKSILAAAMVMGRLEMLVILSLFATEGWTLRARAA